MAGVHLSGTVGCCFAGTTGLGLPETVIVRETPAVKALVAFKFWIKKFFFPNVG